MKKGVCVFKKENVKVLLFSDHHNGVAVQLIRTVEAKVLTNNEEEGGEPQMRTVKKDHVLRTQVVPVHKVTEEKNIRPAVKAAIDAEIQEAKKVLQSDECIAGILKDYESQNGELN